MEKVTPMMQQYLEIKEQCKDAILFFRLGDFYEMFFEDAKVASGVLDIALTGKSCGLEERAPMCGVPFHSADSYIARLVEKGYRVAICEQAEDPKSAKGLVRREIVRVVTPGTILDEGVLASRKTNYMCAAIMEGNESAVVFCEASTGQMMATHFDEDSGGSLLAAELMRMMPVEVIYNLPVHRTEALMQVLEKCGAMKVLYNDMYFAEEYAKAAVVDHFGPEKEEMPPLVVRAVGGLLSYLAQLQKLKPMHITDINLYTSAQFMELDATATANLELCNAMYDKGKKGSLLWVLDRCKTGMGARTMRSWLIRPLLSVTQITARHEAVEELMERADMRDRLCTLLESVSDIERVTGRIVMGTAGARELLKLAGSLSVIPAIKAAIGEAKAPLLQQENAGIDSLSELCDLLSRAITDEPPISVRDGGMIREGFSEELEELREARDSGGAVIATIEAEERERTGIKNLKVRYNKVFGYYIEISRSNLDKVPEEYIRKQTIVNGERFITDKLKKIESVILGASEKMIALEYEIFQSLRARVMEETGKLQRTAHALGEIDTLCSLATAAAKNGYVRPTIDMSEEIVIREGRHPVVECALRDTMFVPNDTTIDTDRNRLAIITGPNMAGKSTYMRQIALIAIMAQMGSFVPAKSCRMGVVDKIFTRIGASDDLSTGRSTFMVEMSEVASILHGATSKSLLILDEIGRGTSTYDGLSIAWAVLEHCAMKLKAKTMFATHYHELTQLEEKMEGVINYNIAVKKRGEDIIFLRKILRGGTDDSYGIEVARLAGVPEAVIRRAKQILHDIEDGSEGVRIRGGVKKAEETGQIGLETLAGNEITEELRRLDVNTLSPIEALGILFTLSQKAKETDTGR